jgi:hypothetical protein
MKHLRITLAGVFALFSVFTSFGQQDNVNKISLPAASFKSEPVNMYVAPGSGLLMTYERSGSIPKYFQFSANSNSSTQLTVQVTIDANGQIQTINKALDISGLGAYYEIPVQQYLASGFQDNPDAVIKSVLLTTQSDKVMIRETNFSNTSVNYPIGINQVFVMDMTKINKRYYIHSSYARGVNINIYDKTGLLIKKEKTLLNVGDNFITMELLMDLKPDKYVIVVTDVANTNVSTTMTVMF